MYTIMNHFGQCFDNVLPICFVEILIKIIFPGNKLQIEKLPNRFSKSGNRIYFSDFIRKIFIVFLVNFLEAFKNLFGVFFILFGFYLKTSAMLFGNFSKYF